MQKLKLCLILSLITSCVADKPINTKCFGLEDLVLEGGNLNITPEPKEIEGVLYYWKDEHWWVAKGRDILTRPTEEWVLSYQLFYEEECY